MYTLQCNYRTIEFVTTSRTIKKTGSLKKNMMEYALFIPKMLVGGELDHLIRDFLVLTTVASLRTVRGIGSHTPRKLYVALSMYILFADMINDLCYRILQPNEKLRSGWKELQKSQVKEDIVRYMELKCKENFLQS